MRKTPVVAGLVADISPIDVFHFIDIWCVISIRSIFGDESTGAFGKAKGV